MTNLVAHAHHPSAFDSGVGGRAMPLIVSSTNRSAASSVTSAEIRARAFSSPDGEAVFKSAAARRSASRCNSRDAIELKSFAAEDWSNIRNLLCKKAMALCQRHGNFNYMSIVC
jgi:hypothetical protein